MPDDSTGQHDGQADQPGPSRLDALEERFAHLERETRALRDAVHDLAAMLSARGASLSAPPATAHPAPPPPPALAPPHLTPPAPRPVPSQEAPMAAASGAPQPPAPPIPQGRPPAPARRPAPARPAPPPRPPRAPVSIEDLLVKGLLALGGILLLIGAPLGAILILPILPPPARIALGYALAFVLSGIGFGLSFRALWPGRLVLIIGVALAFFTSFAAGFIPATQVVPPFVSVALMFLFVGILAVCSEAWKSESVAGFGFLLGLVAALTSAPTSQAMALVALVILAIAAGALLVRHEWLRLNAMALIMIGLGTIFLWIIAPVGEVPGTILAHLGALACYYIIFTVAFARWGRGALARERLAIEAPEQHATPPIKLDAATLAYSSVFAQVNSVAFGALAIWLLLITEVFWPVVHIPLLVMGALEGIRLTVPILRRGTLLGFHTVTSLGLLSAAIVAFFSGLAESAVLALLTLVVALLASRSSLLGWLRPLTLITACLSLHGYDPTGSTLFVDVLARLLPPVFLLASVLPWESIAVLRPRRISGGVVEILEIFSGNARAAIASVLMTVVLMDWFSPGDPLDGGLIIAAKCVFLIAGLLFLNAWNWFAAVAISAIFATFIMGIEHDGRLVVPMATACWAIFCVTLWHEISRRTTSTFGRVITGLAVLALATMTVIINGAVIPMVPACNGLFLTILAVVLVGMGLLVDRTMEWPRLVVEPAVEEGQWSIFQNRRIPDGFWRHVRVAWGAGVALALVGWAQIIIFDSRNQLFSAALITAVWVALWLFAVNRPHWHPAMRWVFAFAALFTICPSVLVAGDGRGYAVAVVFLFSAAAVAAALARREKSILIPGALWLAALGALALFALHVPANVRPLEGWTILVSGAGLLLLAILIRRGLAHSGLDAHRQHFLRGILAFSAVVCILASLASESTMPRTLATASWGLAAACLLASGFLARDIMIRYAGFGVFVLAIGRIFVNDFARMDTITRFVAVVGVGLLMLASGVVYWWLRPKPEVKSGDNNP